MRILIFFTMVLFGVIPAKTQIVLCGEVDSIVKTKISAIILYKPIAHTSQPWYTDSLDDIPVSKTGARFYKMVDDKVPGLYYLGMPNGQQFKVLAVPGDTVYFSLSIDDQTFQIKFTGNNEFANTFTNTIGRRTVAAITGFHKERFDMPVLWAKIDSLIFASNAQIQQNEKHRFRIDFLTRLVQLEVLNAIINCNGGASADNPDYARCLAICEEAYRRFDPLQANDLPISTATLIGISKLGNHIREKKIKFSASRFSAPDSNWAHINDGYITPSTFPEPFREAQIGSFILIDACKFKSDYSEQAMRYFSYQYPNSAYAAIFLKILLNSKKPGEPQSLQNSPAGKHAEVIFIKEEIDLNAALKKYAFNKRVLIDCWATWCIYCIAEFPYYPKFERFFKDNDIVKLFISYDNPKNKNHIEKIITNNKLSGIHLVVTPAIKKQISKLINFQGAQPLPLPRYILLDKGHRVVDADLIRPSDPNFENHIKKKINRIAG